MPAAGLGGASLEICWHGKSKRKRSPKTVLKLHDLEQLKSAVLNSLTSASSQRSYDHAIREFIEWYCSEPRLAFNKIVVTRYRIHWNRLTTLPLPSISDSRLCGGPHMKLLIGSQFPSYQQGRARCK